MMSQLVNHGLANFNQEIAAIRKIFFQWQFVNDDPGRQIAEIGETALWDWQLHWNKDAIEAVTGGYLFFRKSLFAQELLGWFILNINDDVIEVLMEFRWERFHDLSNNLSKAAHRHRLHANMLPDKTPVVNRPDRSNNRAIAPA